MPKGAVATTPIGAILKNVGSTTFNQMYGGNRYIIEPGHQQIVPWEAMCLWMGHPEAIDIDKKRRYRTQEFQRLCVKWGVYEHYEQVAEKFPQMEAYDVEGNRLITVVDDPEGKHLTPQVRTAADNIRLEDQVATLQKQLAALMAQVSERDRAEAANLAAGDTRTDEPAVRPTHPTADTGQVETIPGLPEDALPPDPDWVDEEGEGDVMVDKPERVRVGPRTN